MGHRIAAAAGTVWLGSSSTPAPCVGKTTCMGTNTAAVRATYKHECPADCGQSIIPGDRIVWREDGYIHEDCHDPFQEVDPKEPRHRAEPLDLQPREVVCKACHLAHAGECF